MRMAWSRIGLLALSGAIACGWQQPSQAQTVPAPKWCVDILESKPKPMPIVELLERIRAGLPIKDPYDATAAFDLRLGEALATVRMALASTYGSSRVVVQAPISASYEADRGFFDVRGIATSASAGPGEPPDPSAPRQGYDQVVIETRGGTDGRVADGASRTAQGGERHEYGAALVNLRLANANSWLQGHFTVPVTRERAAGIDGKISVVIVGELMAPGIIENVSRQAPTAGNPNEVTTNRHYVALNAACGAVIATKTGELLQRLN